MTISPILMPQLGVNDDVVKLLQWNVERGARVAAGQEIALLETTKASFALEAESAGYLYPLVEGGQEVAVRSVLALVAAEPDEQAAAAHVAGLQPKGSEDRAASLQLTAKARELIAKAGVDVSRLPADRLIRERDVLELLAERAPPTASPLRRDATRVVAVYGASQGGIALVEAIRAMGGYQVAGFLDDTPHLAGTTVFGLPVWSGGELEALAGRGIGALASHIAVREFRLRMRDRAFEAGLAMLNVIHPTAFVSPSVEMGVGNVIKAGAVIDTEVRMGDCCIIDNRAVVPHHNRIGDACHLAPGVTMGGGCSVGECTLLGVGTIVSSRIQIGRKVIARPGSVVVNDIPDDVLIGGNPAKIVGKRR